MMFSARERSGAETMVREALEPVIHGLGLRLVGLSVSQRKGRGRSPGATQVRLVVYREGDTGIDDCALAHRAALPRLEIAFPGREIDLEVSSPGTDRLLKDGRECACFVGRGVRCYAPAMSDWVAGRLTAVDERGITLMGPEGEQTLAWEAIAKARLDGGAGAPRVEGG